MSITLWQILVGLILASFACWAASPLFPPVAFLWQEDLPLRHVSQSQSQIRYGGQIAHKSLRPHFDSLGHCHDSESLHPDIGSPISTLTFQQLRLRLVPSQRSSETVYRHGLSSVLTIRSSLTPAPSSASSRARVVMCTVDESAT